MTLSQSQLLLPVPVERIMEIQAMAEAGKFGDALVRLRTIKSSAPRNTFLVAVEKQLERLIVMPAESNPQDGQRLDALTSIPRLLSCAVEGMRLSHMAATVQSRMPRVVLKVRSEKEEARDRLKGQYFTQAEEYLKEGAYGSALVEVRRVRIISPDDKTVAEYERIIRQLVELKQRAGVHDLPGRDTKEALRESPRGSLSGSHALDQKDGCSGLHNDMKHQEKKTPGKWFTGKLLLLVVGSSVLLAIAGAAALN